MVSSNKKQPLILSVFPEALLALILMGNFFGRFDSGNCLKTFKLSRLHAAPVSKRKGTELGKPVI